MVIIIYCVNLLGANFNSLFLLLVPFGWECIILLGSIVFCLKGIDVLLQLKCHSQKSSRV